MGFYINGTEPEIVGKLCQGLYLIQHQENGVVTDPANTIFFKFGYQWKKLHFDGKAIFWRDSEEPSDPVNSCLDSYLVLLNFCELEGVFGYCLKDITYGGDDESVFAKFEFLNGKTLCFTYYGSDDYTAVNYI